jgi:hypothetical protein
MVSTGTGDGKLDLNKEYKEFSEVSKKCEDVINHFIEKHFADLSYEPKDA